MSLIEFKCKNCGGKIQMDDSQENGFCMYCGNKFMVKDELVRIAIEHSGSVQVDRKQEVSNLLIRAMQKVEEVKKCWYDNGTMSVNQNNFFKSINDDYIEKALDIDPNNIDIVKTKNKILDIQRELLDDMNEKRLEADRRGTRGCMFFVLALIGIAVLIAFIFLAQQ